MGDSYPDGAHKTLQGAHKRQESPHADSLRRATSLKLSRMAKSLASFSFLHWLFPLDLVDVWKLRLVSEHFFVDKLSIGT